VAVPVGCNAFFQGLFQSVTSFRITDSPFQCVFGHQKFIDSDSSKSGANLSLPVNCRNMTPKVSTHYGMVNPLLHIMLVTAIRGESCRASKLGAAQPNGQVWSDSMTLNSGVAYRTNF